MEKDISKSIVLLTKKIRTVAYKYGEHQMNYDEIPFGGSIRESIGPFPEFILKGRFCKRSLAGLCSPCFYSRLPIHELSEGQLNEGYIAQVNYITQNFEKIVIKNQLGKVSCSGSKKERIYGMVCTPTGSYFDENEYPISVRKENLRQLLETTIQHNCEIVLHIESHAEDVIKYFANPDIEEISLLQKLHTRILLGFESVDDFSRNVIYSKSLSIDNFKKAVQLLKKNSFSVGAFVFAGLFSYTEAETIQDVTRSLIFLKNMEVSPVLMFANTQKYTIPDVLYREGHYKLLDPRTVCTIVEKTIEIFGCDMNGNIDPWFIADPKGGPPDPHIHIFNAESNATCSHCSQKIYDAIEKLRITKSKEDFMEIVKEVSDCECLAKYNDMLHKQFEVSESNSIYDRVMSCVEHADNMLEYYILKENPWKIKAELLCYGLYITEEQKKKISTVNPFIYEKGFVNAIHILYKDILINVCVSENFCKKSPYTICQSEKGTWVLVKNKITLEEITFLDIPSWVYKRQGGDMIGQFARPHSEKCISLWPSMDCTYIRENKGCAYCGLNAIKEEDMMKLSPEYVAVIVKKALDYDSGYEINLSGGTCGSQDEAIEYLTSICRKIIETCGKVPISVECTPPTERIFLYKLKEAGATAIILNIEIFNEQIRQKICPGKGQISNEKYFDALEAAVKIFGKGNVSSVLIVGIQPKQDVEEACNKLINMGVIPTLIPFKPLDNTPMEIFNVTDSDEYISLSQKVATLMRTRNLAIDKKSGCASCGACSIETDLKGVKL